MLQMGWLYNFTNYFKIWIFSFAYYNFSFFFFLHYFWIWRNKYYACLYKIYWTCQKNQFLLKTATFPLQCLTYQHLPFPTSRSQLNHSSYYRSVVHQASLPLDVWTFHPLSRGNIETIKRKKESLKTVEHVFYSLSWRDI